MIELGRRKGELDVDLPRLVGGCALVQGTRGSGKSYIVRVIAEQTIPAGLQTLVLDPEGEFATLREKADLLIAGPSGDLPVEVRSAKLLARRLAEHGISAVLDMSRLSLDEQAAYVDEFLTALDRLPKSLETRSRLVVLDEAHRFCPESGKGRSRARDAVVLLMSQGRKRGLGAILVTQRLSKLSKDAAAEAGNLFICRTSPIDLVRAQDLLGITSSEREALRTLETGFCYATGPALSKPGVVAVAVRKAQTTHPEPGSRYKLSPPPPRAAVKRVLDELKDLPPAKEVEEAATLAEAQKKIRELEAELRKLRSGPSPKPESTDRAKLQAAMAKQTAKLTALHKRKLSQIYSDAKRLHGSVHKFATQLQGTATSLDDLFEVFVDDLEHDLTVTENEPSLAPVAPPKTPRTRAQPSTRTARRAANGDLGGGMTRILLALASVGGAPRNEVAILSRLAPNSGTFSTYLGRLRAQNFICDEGHNLVITEDGIASLGDFSTIPTGGAELIEAWRAEVGGGGMGRIFDALAAAGAEGLDRNALAAASGLEATSGTFSTYLGRLRKKGILNGRSWPCSLHEVFFR